MYIGKNWKIESDELNVILSKRSIIRKGINKGKESWIVKGYYATVENAYKALVDTEIRDTELTDLKTIVDKIEEIKSWKVRERWLLK